MAMAHRAPMDAYKKHCTVKQHAIERLRERFKAKGDLAHRDDKDVSNRVDEAIRIAMRAERYEEILDRGKRTMLVDVSEPLQDSLYGIVREDEDTGRLVVVTLLTGTMVEKNRARGRWDELEEPDTGKFKLGDQIGDQLANVQPAGKAGIEIVTIRFRLRNGRDLRYEDWERADVKNRLSELANDPEVDPNSIAKARFEPVKVKTVVMVVDD